MLSAAIDKGTYFLISSKPSTEKVRIVSGNLGDDEVSFDLPSLLEEAKAERVDKLSQHTWANYIKGVLIEVRNSTG